MILGAGLLIACAAGAAVAGPYFPAGIALAALFVWAARHRGIVATCGKRRLPRADGGERVIRRGLRAGTRLALAAMIAGTAAAYLVPGERELAAAGLVVLAGVVAGWLDVPDTLRRALAVVLAAAAMVFVGVCFGLAPAAPANTAASGLGGEQITLAGVVAALPGVLLTAVLFVALFDGVDGIDGARREPRAAPDGTRQRPLDAADDVPHGSRAGALVRLAVGTTLAIAVSIAALYQLGPVRLGLANTSLRDALAAADATALTTLFNTVVVLATVPALLAVLASARRELAATGPAARAATGRRATIVVTGYALAAAATLLGPPTALAVASTLTIGDMLTGFFLRNRRCRARASSDTVPP
ncbi:hypothetical protein [Haloechinothrix halophila]|uniref:hypothetical protein n=1 Tax=Haloechinothrix halophila TaxID=1069073 RepID=UPI00040F18B8|nr:hypothetical protein [Haloechinothrix halophila]